MTMIKTMSYRYKVNNSITTNLQSKRGLRQGNPLSPLLFVLVIEYLYKVLHKLYENHNFNFHSKCEKLNIVNLSFADDSLLFAIKDIRYVKLVMQAFNSFSKSTSLTMNPSKCKTYFGNVEDNVKLEILNITGFVEGHLPFRYLGIPITSKKIFVSYCIGMVDRFVNKIRHWSSRLLSFTGRTQLIKSVLFALSNLYAMLVNFQRVEVACRSFL